MSKYILYLKYIIRHKWYVGIECFKMGVYWRGITHDLSKFLPSEFIPYAKYFYGDYGINNKCPAKWLSRTVMKVKNDLISLGYYTKKEINIIGNIGF